MSNTSFDVAIIGGGPAGTSAAKKTAEAGLKTILFEEHDTLGIPVQCGEGVSRKLLEIHKIDHKGGKADWIKIHLPKQHFYFPGTERLYGKKEFGAYKMISGYDSFLVDRTSFDQMLAKEAEDKGTEIRTGSKVTNLTIDSNKGAEISVKNIKGENYTVNAKMVVAADGPASRMAKHVGLNIFDKFKGLKYVHAVEWKLEGKLSETLDFYFDHDLVPNGYTWTFPKKDTSTIGLVCEQIQEPWPRLEKLMTIMEAKLGQKFKKIKLVGGMIPASPQQPVKTYNPRFIVAGDAGGFTNPLFYGGISISILTGRLAGEAVVETANKDPNHSFKEQDLKIYEDKWRSLPQFSPDMYQGRNLFYDNFTNKELEVMGKFSDNIHVTRLGWVGRKWLAMKAGFVKDIRQRRKDYEKVINSFSLSGDWGF
jgi:digeranylgeranylglycerophospholipid reductase